jgi:hypothetical protein
MAESKAKDERLPGEGEPEADQPAESSLLPADAVSGPDVSGTTPNDPPLRTNRPDEPMVQTLATGAGAHTPVDDPDFDEQGRYIGPAPGRPKGVPPSETRSTATSRKADEKENR